MEQFAVRNLRLCNKDCLCLYVCPFGATDTEDSIIDVSKCNGCGVCAQSCPSGAITMMPKELPPQQPKTAAVKTVLDDLAQAHADSEKCALQIAKATESDGLSRLMLAIAKSERLVEEDIMREDGYMLPQSANAQKLLRALVANPPSADFPVEAARKLIELIPANEPLDEAPAKTLKYKCLICGAEFEVAEGTSPVCPVCGVSDLGVLELID